MPDAEVTSKPAAFVVADAITLVRLPLAVAFPFFTSTSSRLILLALACVTDLGDGWWARRFGGSRIGVILDPIVDKLFMAAAFGVVLFSGALAWYEVVALLTRDIVASIAFFITVGTGHATTVPARAGGKAVTVLQLLTLLAFVLGSTLIRPLAWATAAVALYALYDYNSPFFRKLSNR